MSERVTPLEPPYERFLMDAIVRGTLNSDAAIPHDTRFVSSDPVRAMKASASARPASLISSRLVPLPVTARQSTRDIALLTSSTSSSIMMTSLFSSTKCLASLMPLRPAPKITTFIFWLSLPTKTDIPVPRLHGLSRFYPKRHLQST